MHGDEFEWDDDKAERNLAKHGVSFETGRRVFDDAFAVEHDDVRGVGDEPRVVVTVRRTAWF